MRNLKRALSLTLASVMLLGMMVVGAGAASYPDVSEEDNIEAIEVLQAVQVMRGDDKGNFNPDSSVTRAEMAVVMALLLDLDYQYYEATCPFNDVPAWARPYVGACYANGIVSGYNATTYGSNDGVTAVQAASMLMRALGYFKYASDYKDGFETATVRQASKILLFEGVNANARDNLTRDQVARLALNALQTPIVEAKDNTINISSTSGDANVTVTGGQVDYVVTASSQPYAYAIGKTEHTGEGLNQVSGCVIELGEKLYNGKLKLNEDARDVFGRPSRLWEYDGKEVGTYAKKENIRQTYTVEVTGKDLYDLIGKATIDDTKNWNFNLYVDGINLDDKNAEAQLDSADNKFDGYFTRGELANNNKAGIGATGKGVTTQVFVDSEKKDVDIVVVNTYLAKAQSDYKEKTDDVSLDVYKIANKGTTSAPVYVKFNSADADDEDAVTLRVLGEDFSVVKDIKEKDLLLVTVADGEVQTIADPDILSGATLNAFKKGSWVNADNTQYDYASTAEYDVEVLDQYTSINGTENLKDRLYNVILDQYGYMVGLELVEDVKNYVFVAGIDADASNLKNQVADANLIFLDGTRETAKVDLDKSTSAPYISNGKYVSDGLLDRKLGGGRRVESDGDYALLNTWCTYTVNTSGVYTLTEVAAQIDDGTGNTDGLKIKTAQYHDNVNGDKINTKNPYLTGSNTSYAKVYGNNDSVYLTAKMDYVRYNGTDYAAVITGADNVTVNVDNADLTIEDSATVLLKDKFTKVGATIAAGGVYTLYNDKGIVIAAMVVGKDNGATNRLVYVHTDDIERESYDPKTAKATTDGDWTWVRKVIFEGEEIELTESGDSLQYISPSSPTPMIRDNVYKISYNANGEVVSSADVFLGGADMVVGPAQNSTAAAAEAEAIYRAVDINPSLKKYDTVVFQRDYKDNENDKDTYTYNNRPRLEGDTLYVETTDNTGVRVDSNVKTVLTQEKSKKTETTYYTNSTQLKNIIKDLNESEELDHSFKLTLFINKGAVRYVVIRDMIGNGYVPNKGNTEGIVNVDISDPTDVIVEWYGDSEPEDDDCLAAVIEKLEDTGRTIVDVSWDAQNSKWVIKTERTVRGKVVKEEYNYDGDSDIENIKITVDGTEVYIDNTDVDTFAELAALVDDAGKDIVADQGTYVYGVLNGADADYIQIDGSTLTIAEGDSFEFGYYKVTVNATVTKTGAPTGDGSGTWSAQLPDDADDNPVSEIYVKKAAKDITVELASDAASAGKLTVQSDDGTVVSVDGKKGSSLPTQADAFSVDVVVRLTAADITDDVEIVLEIVDFVNDVSINVTYNGETKVVTVPETTDSWVTILEEAGWDNDYAARSGKVRLDTDWTKGEAVGEITDSAFVDSGAIKSGLSVTFGCLEMGRAADTNTEFAGTGVITWTAGTTAWDSQSAKYYMVPNEVITVVVDLSKVTASGGTAVKAGAAPSIAIGGATNSSVGTPSVTALAVKTAAADATAVTAGTSWADNTLTITGVAEDNVITAGKITFTITVGSSADASLKVTTANPAS